MQGEDLSKQKPENPEVEQNLVLDEAKQAEYQDKILRLFKILHQINLKKKIVKIQTYEEVKNIRNTNNAS